MIYISNTSVFVFIQKLEQHTQRTLAPVTKILLTGLTPDLACSSPPHIFPCPPTLLGNEPSLSILLFFKVLLIYFERESTSQLQELQRERERKRILKPTPS